MTLQLGPVRENADSICRSNFPVSPWRASWNITDSFTEFAPALLLEMDESRRKTSSGLLGVLVIAVSPGTALKWALMDVSQMPLPHHAHA